MLDDLPTPERCVRDLVTSVLIHEYVSDQFFTPTIYGIQDACAFYGCHYQWTGSKQNVVSEMVSAMQTAMQVGRVRARRRI
jgi:hypothetical protein